MAEDILYTDDNIEITTTRVSAGGTTYALRNITSVKMAITPASYGCAIILLILTIISVFGAMIVASEDPSPKAISIAIAFVVFFVFGSVVAFNKAKPDYHVEIHSASGEAKAFTSADKKYIEKIVQSINEAIVAYQ